MKGLYNFINNLEKFFTNRRNQPMFQLFLLAQLETECMPQYPTTLNNEPICIPRFEKGEDLNCNQIGVAVQLQDINDDPYNLDEPGNSGTGEDGKGCISYPKSIENRNCTANKEDCIDINILMKNQ